MNLKKIITGITLAVSVISTYAQSFKIDGLYYRVLDESSVELYRDQSQGNSFTHLEGNVNVPEDVIYNGKSYQVTKIGSSYFAGNKGLISISLPKTIKEIGGQAFTVTSLEEVILPKSVNKIGSEAFRNCEKLKEITIPEGVSEIRENTFSGCSVLESITLPKTLNKIGYFAFSSLYSLKEIIVENPTPPLLVSPSFPNTPKDGWSIGKKGIKVRVLKGAKSQYESTEEWKEFSIVEDQKILRVSDESKKASLKVYPNPITNVFFIETENSAPAVIFSIAGEKVKAVNLNKGQNKIDVTGMPKGIYILKIDNYTRKIEVK